MSSLVKSRSKRTPRAIRSRSLATNPAHRRAVRRSRREESYSGITADELYTLLCHVDGFLLRDMAPEYRLGISSLILAVCGGPMPENPLEVYREFMGIWRSSGRFDVEDDADGDEFSEIVATIVLKFLHRIKQI